MKESMIIVKFVTYTVSVFEISTRVLGLMLFQVNTIHMFVKVNVTVHTLFCSLFY